MIIYPSRFLTRAETWYDEEPAATPPVDWILYNHRSRPVAGAKWRYFHTYVINLTLDVEQLLGNLAKDNAYKIRRARDRDGIVCEWCDPRDPAVLDRCEDMYRSFATRKGLPPLNRPRLDGMVATGNLDLSAAKDPQGNVLVYHANYRDARRATQLHSPSLYPNVTDSAVRNRIGRANRLLFWSNFLRYQEQGLREFDFGGWYPGTTDRARLSINEFKRSFGGEVRREYECEQILTLKGRLILAVAGLLKRAKLLHSAPKPQAPQSPAIEVRQPAPAASM